MIIELDVRRMGTKQEEVEAGAAMWRGARAAGRALWQVALALVCLLGLCVVWGACARVLWELVRVGWTYFGWWQ